MADEELGYEDERMNGGEGTEPDLDAFDPTALTEGPGQTGPKGFRRWLNVRRSWILMIGLAIAQAIFAVIMINLRSDAKPLAVSHTLNIKELATDMLGYEVKVGQIYQLIPGRGGRRVTIGLDAVLILGQLPAELVDGAPRPNQTEMEMFIATIKAMEDRIRSQVNILLQKIPPEDYGTVEALKIIKQQVKDYVNDSLDGFNFGKQLRDGISKRRVTEVLLPMFIRQRY